MKISKKSWHYRLLKSWTPKEKLVDGELPRRNLCSYFSELMMLLVFIVVFYTPAVCLFGPIFLFIDWQERRAKANPKPPPQPNDGEPKTLVGKWIKAKKEKVCPILEWTE